MGCPPYGCGAERGTNSTAFTFQPDALIMAGGGGPPYMDMLDMAESSPFDWCG